MVRRIQLDHEEVGPEAAHLGHGARQQAALHVLLFGHDARQLALLGLDVRDGLRDERACGKRGQGYFSPQFDPKNTPVPFVRVRFREHHRRDTRYPDRRHHAPGHRITPPAATSASEQDTTGWLPAAVAFNVYPSGSVSGSVFPRGREYMTPP